MVIDLASGAGHLNRRESKEEAGAALSRLPHLTWLDLIANAISSPILTPRLRFCRSSRTSRTSGYPHRRAVKERYRTAWPVASSFGGKSPAPGYCELCATLLFPSGSPIRSALPVNATPHLGGSHLASHRRLPMTPALPRGVRRARQCRTTRPRRSGRRRAGALEAAVPTHHSICSTATRRKARWISSAAHARAGSSFLFSLSVVEPMST
jgi:hypothetical protein